MRAIREQSADNERKYGRKRPKTNKGPRGGTPSQPAPLAEDSRVQQGSSEILPENTAPVPISFESRIALALQGSSWQELQHSFATVQSLIPVPETVKTEPAIAVEDEINKPPGPTAKQKKKKEQFDRTIARDTGNVLQIIHSESVTPVTTSVMWDQDPELLCSYNWQASYETNTIFVPGAPAKWYPPTLPHTLEPDSGYSYADYNYARQPRTPYEPMFQALSMMNPNYQFMDVDVLADRNNLRILLEFVSGKANGPFRLDLYALFNTLVIVRNESKWWKFADGKSYGGNFERFFTRPEEGMEDATSHYRAIRYPMGPLSVVVRFEADAYDDGVASDQLTQSETQAVSGGLAARPTFKFGAPIRVLQKGHIVPTAQMVELKTQTVREEFRPVACQDQLWFGRTKLLYTGPYVPNDGTVKRVRFEDATARVKKWEDNQQENLRKLVGLLDLLKQILKRNRSANNGLVLVREDKAGPLTVRSMESNSRAVGRDALQRHWIRAPRPPPQQQQQQFGGHRGQRGGARGYTTAAPRGRGYADAGRSYAGTGNGGHYQPTAYTPDYDGRGGYAGRGGSGSGQYGPIRGGDQSRRPNY